MTTDMTRAEALQVSDDIAAAMPGRTPALTALVTLAREVRQLQAECERLRIEAAMAKEP